MKTDVAALRRFAFTISVGAALLFLVQPMVARALLPWFGGSAGVWTTCQLFFQLLLLGGYGWTHLLVTRLSPRRQVRAQRGLVIVAFLSLVATAAWWSGPIIPGEALRPADSTLPIARLLLTLLLSVGLPYFALATTGPLLQSWAASAKVTTGSVYRLYALSNAGSLLGLLAYPFLLERLTTLRVQGWLWAVGFGAWLLGLGLSGRLVKSDEAPRPAGPATRERAPWPTWLALSFGPVVLFLAVTNHLTQEVAPMPFLWVLPLVAYLASLILTFESERWYGRRWALPLLGVLSIGAALLRWDDHGLPLGLIVLVYLAFLLVACLAAHGELARTRPEPARLTTFYGAMATGGALGGVFAGLVAPLLFRDFYEVELGAVFVLGALAFQQAGRVRWAGLAVTAVVLGLFTYGMRDTRMVVLESRRDFFGVLRVALSGTGDAETNVLTHGRTMHGAQGRHHREQPTTYYVRESGIGELLSLERPGPRRVGVIGLGVGTLAAYGRPGDLFRFYEISPAVVELARGEGGYFTFLAESKATVEIALGDARTTLEREAPQGFNVLVLDAFSSDSVPVHLLTKEALALYLTHLAPGGVLALHLSNRSLDLAPIANRLARELDLRPVTIARRDNQSSWGFPSVWLMLVRARDYPTLAPGKEPEGPLWTDDYSSLWSVAMWGG